MEHGKSLEILTSQQEGSSESSEYLEKLILQSLAFLPGELREKWTEKFEEAEDLAVFKVDLLNLLEKRRNIFSTVEIFPEATEEMKKEAQEVMNVIGETFGNRQFFLGYGMVAEVYELPTAPHLCVKYVKNEENYALGNRVRAEFDLLSQLRGVKVENVRTPIPCFIHDILGGRPFYGMEKVRGKSLHQLATNPEEHRELIEIIKNMDKNEAMVNITSFIKRMHEVGISHNDLHRGNIMIDEEGNFFVIDFGKGKREEFGEDHEQYKHKDLADLDSEIRSFFNLTILN